MIPAMLGAGRKVQRPRKAKKNKGRAGVRVPSMASVSPSVNGEEARTSRSLFPALIQTGTWVKARGGKSNQSKASCLL